MNQELQDLLASVRGELEVGLKKQASVEELTDEHKTFIDAAIEEIEKHGRGWFNHLHDVCIIAVAFIQ